MIILYFSSLAYSHLRRQISILVIFLLFPVFGCHCGSHLTRIDPHPAMTVFFRFNGPADHQRRFRRRRHHHRSQQPHHERPCIAILDLNSVSSPPPQPESPQDATRTTAPTTPTTPTNKHDRNHRRRKISATTLAIYAAFTSHHRRNQRNIFDRLLSHLVHNHTVPG